MNEQRSELIDLCTEFITNFIEIQYIDKYILRLDIIHEQINEFVDTHLIEFIDLNKDVLEMPKNERFEELVHERGGNIELRENFPLYCYFINALYMVNTNFTLPENIDFIRLVLVYIEKDEGH